MTLNGCLAGLVAVTAPCAYVSVGSSMLIGSCAGGLVVLAVLAFDRLKIDDPVGALSVHLVNGVFGTLCVGLLAQDGIGGLRVAPGLFFGGGWGSLLAQATAVAAVGAFVFTSCFLLWFALRLTIGVRVTLEEEIQGLDFGEHGNSAYPQFLTRRSFYAPLRVHETASGALSRRESEQ